MQTRNVVLVSAAAFVAYHLFRKQIAGGTLLFSPDKVRAFRFDGITPVFQIGLLVQNTSNQNFTLNSIAADVTADTYSVGNVSAFGAQVIPANSQRILLLDVRLFSISIVNELIKAFQYKDFLWEVKVNGTANVDGLQVPLRLTYKIGLGQ